MTPGQAELIQSQNPLQPTAENLDTSCPIESQAYSVMGKASSHVGCKNRFNMRKGHELIILVDHYIFKSEINSYNEKKTDFTGRLSNLFHSYIELCVMYSAG